MKRLTNSTLEKLQELEAMYKIKINWDDVGNEDMGQEKLDAITRAIVIGKVKPRPDGFTRYYNLLVSRNGRKI